MNKKIAFWALAIFCIACIAFAILYGPFKTTAHEVSPKALTGKYKVE